MTTIAYKDNVIAFDSRETAGGMIMSDTVDKKVIINDVTFFTAGSVYNFKEFHDAYFKENATISEDNDCYAFVIDDGELLLVSATDGLIRKSTVSYPDAIGSGYVFALAYMDCGQTAKQAVEATAKRDVGTGGTVHEFHIKNKTI